MAMYNYLNLSSINHDLTSMRLIQLALSCFLGLLEPKALSSDMGARSVNVFVATCYSAESTLTPPIIPGKIHSVHISLHRPSGH